MKAILVSILLVGASFAKLGDDSELLLRSFVVSGQNAYFVSPNRLVLSDDVSSVDFLPGDRYALITGTKSSKMTGEAQLKSMLDMTPKMPPSPWVKLWDLKSDLLREASPEIVKMLIQEEADIQFTSQPGVALLVSTKGPEPLRTSVEVRAVPTELETSIWKVNFIENSVTPIKTFRSSGSVTVDASPNRPIFVVQTIKTNNPVDRMDLKSTIEFTVFDLSGRATKTGSKTLPGFALIDEWTSTGENMVGVASRRRGPGLKPEQKTLVLNISTGMINETVETVAVYEKSEDKTDIELMVSSTAVQLGESKRAVYSLWVVGSKPSKDNQCLVSGGIDGGYWISPNTTQIAFVEHGKLFASEVVKVDLATLLKAKEAAERNIAMSNSKQVATGIIIYSSDYDDAFPLQNGFEDSVMPYLKNREILNGFVYTYTGGPAASLKDPSSTEIGYVPAPGGRCVAYADGHVKFVKNP